MRLIQDPELWDEKGDSLVFFSRNRTEPSFRIHSSLLRETGSDTLVDMLLYGTVRSFGNIPGISHKIYLDLPPGVKEKTEVLRHYITTRNFFAFLQRKCLVGFTFYQALVDLHERLEEYLPPGTDCTAAIRSYLDGIGLVNVSNEPRAAAGLLAWSEDVRWNEGWREAFVHCVGMYELLSQLQESADISLPTKAHLDRKYLELQVRIQEVQDCFGKWYFDDAHFAQEDEPPSVQQAADHFRKFLKLYYQKEYENWPIKRGPEAGNVWLDRKVTQRLQEDFGALYEYLVDRNVTWNDGDESNEKDRRQKRKATLISNSENFWLDSDDDRMLSVFRNLDCRLNSRDHIPHPYPILPASMPPPTTGTSKKKGIFNKEKKKDTVRKSRLAHAYNEATNASQLGREYAFNSLTRAFVSFEKADQPDVVDPREARRERWIIIYCVLSTLAGISVDVPNLSFKNVDYFLNTRLEGLPPWCPEEKIFLEALPEQSHCWTSPLTWEEETYERRVSKSSARRSISRCSETSKTAYNGRPLSPDFDGSAYAFLSKPADSLASGFQFSTKYVGTRPSQFSHFDGPHRDITASYTSRPQPAGIDKNFQPSTFASTEPFKNTFEPSSKSASSIPELCSSDDFSDCDSAPPLTKASSSTGESKTDRSSSNRMGNYKRPLQSKFAKLSGIEEYEARPLPLRPGARNPSKGEKAVMVTTR